MVLSPAKLLTGGAVAAVLLAVLAPASAPAAAVSRAAAFEDASTATPIKHLVVIFQENASFDHYFGTYPDALNPPGEPRFTAKPGTPHVNGLTPELLLATNRSSTTRRPPTRCTCPHRRPI